MADEASADPAMSLTRELRLRHQAMMNRNLEQRVKLEELEAFIGELVEAGANVPVGRDRDRLRNMLFFWAAERASRLAAASDGGGATNSAIPTGPHAALPELKPYRPSAVAQQTTLSPGQPMRPSDFAERELSDEELAQLFKTRTALRFAALARQYKASADQQRKGYLLSGRALEEARSVMDCDPDIRALVEESDSYERIKRWARRGALSVGVIALIAIISGYFLVRSLQLEAQNLRLAAQNSQLELDKQVSEAERQAVLKEKADILIQLRSALRRTELGDADKLRSFVEVWGDATTRQRASIVARTRIDSPIIQQLQAAVDALEAGNAVPLINLAREIAAPGANGRRAEVELAAKTPTLPPSKVQRPALPSPTAQDAPSCKGWLWLGNEQRPFVSDGAPLRALSPGTRVTVATGDEDLNLRSAAPKPNYAVATAIGVVAANSEVEIIGSPRGYQRPNGLEQIWAEVSTARPFCTQIFIQYVGGDVQRLSQLRDAFLAKGYDVRQPEQLGAAKGKAEVRYYHEEDAPAAQIIAQELTQLAGGRQVHARQQTDDEASGRLDVLIDLGLVR